MDEIMETLPPNDGRESASTLYAKIIFCIFLLGGLLWMGCLAAFYMAGIIK